MALRKIFIVNGLWFARNIFFLICILIFFLIVHNYLVTEEEQCGNVYSLTIEMTVGNN